MYIKDSDISIYTLLNAYSKCFKRKQKVDIERMYLKVRWESINIQLIIM